ncbi:Bug family tripartite tricarboxylate transporter substrate binding protein [Enterovirga aerilata]|uniref:Tripartite tricarboxylate transporter substrate binding protein n=1 Tax=Enterovirga aerilata TaxID=2730920 RepID=A0A849IFK3_9HYPH|nr:tripartite tricarboxylate transporter substrate-binding protein [Enterovirga sp. DB1703]NNM75005.1 tripartite tricarboxylate transporter substrate binding protein [Enterovirga sp. DB1703]
MRSLAALACAALMTVTLPAAGQDYPSKPIRVLVPFAPGGVVDVTARLLTQKMSERLGWSFVVENRPGGNGFIAVTAAAKAAPDGHTLLMAHTGEFAGNPALFPDVPYELERDFKPITMVSDTPMLLVASKDAPFNTFAEVVAAAKEKPGTVGFSSPGNGSINHLAGEWLALQANVKLLHVPYKGGAPAAAAVAAGEVPLGVVAVPAVQTHLRTGRVKVIGLTTAQRTPYDKSWVTAAEGGIPGVDSSNWVGLFAPKGVPDAIVQKLYDEVKATLDNPEVRERFAQAGAVTGGMPPAEFLARIKTDAERYKEVVKKANVKPE